MTSPAPRPAGSTAACSTTGRDLGLEGFMVKRADAPYLPGRRSDGWAKVKCVRRREFVVGGWLEGQRSRTGGLGSLALGVWDAPPADRAALRRAWPDRG